VIYAAELLLEVVKHLAATPVGALHVLFLLFHLHFDCQSFLILILLKKCQKKFPNIDIIIK